MTFSGRRTLVLFAAAALWLAGWLWIGRYAMLDDALIHLRYAQGLSHTGLLTYDGVTFSYGASSPLYVALLALPPLPQSLLLPKAASLAGYLLLLGLATAPVWRYDRVSLGEVSLLILLLSPMALRWLTDGMETSLVAVSVLLLASAALHEAPERQPPIILFIFGAAIVLLRIELSLALFFAVLGAIFFRCPKRLGRLAAVASGGLAGIAFLYLLLGHVLPDTAVAKQTVAVSLWTALFQIGLSTGAALSFGIGLVLLWASTLAISWWQGNQAERSALLVANLLFPCLIVLVAVRGQILHGVRHVLWVYLFLIAWNLRISRLQQNVSPAAARPGTTFRKAGVATALSALALLWSVEIPAVAALLRSRSALFLEMRRHHLERLADVTGAAYDIGLVGAFTGAPLLDGNGLVNGRSFAALSGVERTRRIGAERPGFLFVTAPQAAGLKPFLDLDSYQICHRYRSANLRGSQTYFLAAREPYLKRLGTPCLEPLAIETSKEGAR